MEDVFTLKSSSFPTTTRVASFRGREAISQIYEFEIFLIVPGDDAKDFDFADAVGTKATLALQTDWKNPFTFSGILVSIELVHAHGQFALFRAVLVPRLQRLAQTQHSRLFTQQSVPDILKQVFNDNGLTSDDFSLQLSGSYSPEEHVCQYRESDLAFVSRWMEHAGLYYYFEQSDDGEKLIVTDAKASHTDLPTDAVRYVPTMSDDRSAGQAIETFRCRATSLPTSVRLADYDYTKPSLAILGTAPVAPSGFGEINVHASRAFSPGDAAKLAQIRAEEMLARQLEHFGGGTMHLRAGYQFTLEEHPLNALNQKYLATACEHFGNMISSSPDLARLIDLPYKEVYRCEVTAMPASVQFRAQRRTPWPRVHGLEHGVIDGAADSDYAQIDDHGRYCVKFLFDESPLKDGKASTWVRMMQPHGGGIEGFHFPLRKGTEVVLSFWGGDPDRPVIAGVVNTTTTPSPVTSGNNTKNVIQTGGRNRIEIEDKEGQQRITMSSPTANSYIRFGAPNDDHNMIVSTTGQTLLDAGQNLDVTVGTYLMEGVNTYVDETYGGYHNTRVGGTREHTVKGALTETYKATHDMKVTGHQTLTIGSREKTVLGTETEASNGLYTEVRNSAAKSTFNAGLNETITGPMEQTVNGPFTQKISGTCTITTGPTTFKHGPVDCSYDAHHKTTFGGTEETFIGGQIANFIGVKNSNTLAVSFSSFYGVNLTYNGGLKHEWGAPTDIAETALYKRICARMDVATGTYGLAAATTANISAAAMVKLSAGIIKIG